MFIQGERDGGIESRRDFVSVLSNAPIKQCNRYRPKYSFRLQFGARFKLELKVETWIHIALMFGGIYKAHIAQMEGVRCHNHEDAGLTR